MMLGTLCKFSYNVWDSFVLVEEWYIQHLVILNLVIDWRIHEFVVETKRWLEEKEFDYDELEITLWVLSKIDSDIGVQDILEEITDRIMMSSGNIKRSIAHYPTVAEITKDRKRRDKD